MNFPTKCFVVGVVGDACLQLIVKMRGDFAGLRGYFEQHGPLESLCIAGGLMFALGWLYMIMAGEPSNLLYLFIFGGLWDVAFRQLNLMPSLQHTYYKALTPVQSFVWGGIPMVLPALLM